MKINTQKRATSTALTHNWRLWCIAIGFLGLSIHASAQTYTSYFTGDTTDAIATPTGGTCMMGGAVEDDNAMRWFLNRGGGGDVLVLRASGSDGYNAYLYSQLGVSVNSVETIRFDNAAAASDSYVQRRISEAEAIWFAGGDQWDYVSYWRGTAIDSLINEGLHNRHIVIGGTSAGMAILGGYYFSAVNGTVTSATAMGNPYDATVTVDSTHFLEVDYMADVITDTHYDYYDRRGRQVTFLARILTDYGVAAKGIACDEYTAVCIDTAGIASVYGNSPASDDNAYFVQINCEIPNNQPEVCVANQPLQWDVGENAIRVYRIQGTSTGTGTFDLNDWKTGTGGTWEKWWVYNSVLFAQPSTAINCGPVGAIEALDEGGINIFPNPSTSGRIHISHSLLPITQVCITNALGQRILQSRSTLGSLDLSLDISDLPTGLYKVSVEAGNEVETQTLVVE